MITLGITPQARPRRASEGCVSPTTHTDQGSRQGTSSHLVRLTDLAMSHGNHDLSSSAPAKQALIPATLHIGVQKLGLGHLNECDEKELGRSRCDQGMLQRAQSANPFRHAAPSFHYDSAPSTESAGAHALPPRMKCTRSRHRHAPAKKPSLRARRAAQRPASNSNLLKVDEHSRTARYSHASACATLRPEG